MASRISRRRRAAERRGLSSLTAGRSLESLDRRSAQDRAEARWLGSRPSRPTLGVAGVSGTPYSASQNPYEENPELQGRLWPLIVRQMKLDPAVYANWTALKQTLLSAEWRWESADEDDPLANRLRDWAAESWGGMAVPWEQQLGMIFEFATVGFRYQEEEYEVREDSDGVLRVHLARYHDREPAAHEQWVRDPDTGDLLMVTQSASHATRAPEPIPASKLLLCNLGQTGQNYAGAGLFRACWFYWHLKTLAGTNLGIGVERWAVAPVKVRVNRIAAEEAGVSGAVDDLRDAAIDEADGFVTAERAYVVDSDAVTIDEMNTGNAAQAGDAIIRTLQECDQQIAAAFMTQFLRLGITDAGSRGVAETMETFFRRAAVNLLDAVANAVNGPARPGGGTIGRLIGWNFGAVPAAKLPRLVHDGLKVDPLADHLTTIGALAQAGLAVPSRALQDKIHDVLGVPEPTDEEREAADVRATAATPLAFAEAARRRRGGK